MYECNNKNLKYLNKSKAEVSFHNKLTQTHIFKEVFAEQKIKCQDWAICSKIIIQDKMTTQLLQLNSSCCHSLHAQSEMMTGHIRQPSVSNFTNPTSSWLHFSTEYSCNLFKMPLNVTPTTLLKKKKKKLQLEAHLIADKLRGKERGASAPSVMRNTYQWLCKNTKCQIISL